MWKKKFFLYAIKLWDWVQIDFCPSRVIRVWHLIKVKGSSPGQYPLHIPSQTHTFHHIPFSLLAWHPNTSPVQAVLHNINLPFPWPTHWVTTNTLYFIDSISNLSFFILYMAKPSDTFITLNNCLILEFRNPSIESKKVCCN